MDMENISYHQTAFGRQALLLPQVSRPGLVLAGGLLIYLVGAAPDQLPIRGAEVPKDLTKKQQQRLEHSALELYKVGFQHYRHGRYIAATKRLEQALATYQRLYPKTRYPSGHRDLANWLSNLGLLLRAQGKYARALAYYKQALAMCMLLYSKAKFPKRHPNLALNLNNLGLLLKDQGETAQARDYYQQALVMLGRLYPRDQYPQGHPTNLAKTLNNLGLLLNDQEDYSRARDYSQQALAMN
jgi:tetratricopeptide (TPR) repeat protein